MDNLSFSDSPKSHSFLHGISLCCSEVNVNAILEQYLRKPLFSENVEKCKAVLKHALVSNPCNKDYQTSHISRAFLAIQGYNCSFSYLSIDDTTDMFICQVQRRKMPPKVYMKENETLHAIGMLQAGQSKNSIDRHFGKFKSVSWAIQELSCYTLWKTQTCNFATGVTISTDGWGQD